MRKRTRSLISTSVLIMIIGAIFLAGKPPLSSAQEGGFKTYKLVVYCGNSGVATVIFGHEVTTGGTQGRPLMGTHTECAGDYPGCGTGGTVSLEAALARLPAEVSAALKAKVEKHQENAAAGKGRRLTCLGNGKEKPKCEPPRDLKNDPPWFNEDVPCQNRQQATYSWGRNRRNPNLYSVSISICGQVIRYVSTKPIEPLGLFKDDVCCDNWQNAVRTRSPCDAERDIDCDGKLNENDVNPFRAASKEGSSDDFVSNPPLTPTLPFWRQVYESIPEQSDCKDCKWELVGIQYTCKDEVERTGRRSESRNAEYRYQATWKCPANGQTQVTNDTATMEGSQQRRGSPCCRCPSPPSGSWP